MFKKKLTDKGLAAALIVLGLVILAIVYFVPYQNLSDEATQIQMDNDSKRNHIAALQTYYDNRQQYLDDTEVLKKNIVDIASSYPAAYRMEDYIMEGVEIENAVDDNALENNDLIYTSIAAANAITLSAVDAGTVQKANIEEYQDSIIFYEQSVTYSNSVEYTGLKDAIATIFKSAYRVNVQNITFTANYDTGKLDGAFVLGYYYVSGNGVEYVAPSIPAYEAGTVNFFGNTIIGEEEEAGAAE